MILSQQEVHIGFMACTHASAPGRLMRATGLLLDHAVPFRTTYKVWFIQNYSSPRPYFKTFYYKHLSSWHSFKEDVSIIL